MNRSPVQSTYYQSCYQDFKVKAKAKVKDLAVKAKAKAKDLAVKAKAKAKDLTVKAKTKAKDLVVKTTSNDVIKLYNRTHTHMRMMPIYHLQVRLQSTLTEPCNIGNFTSVLHKSNVNTVN
jgi:hypothetical protein